MPGRIEDYALIGDTHTAALVGRDGSVDWWCVPRFDSGAVFAAMLGDREHGRWLLAPAGGLRSTERRYVGDTLVLETTHTTDEGVVRVTDFMPVRDHAVQMVRIVEGVSGRVPMYMDLRIRFDYGSIVPWVRTDDGRLRALAGPDALVLTTPVRWSGADLATVSEFVVSAGERVPFVLAWYPSHEEAPTGGDADALHAETLAWWEEWTRHATCSPDTRGLIMRSLITLKALTYAPTGGIVAAPTTSLPEWIGSVRNWDYRYCWLRDSVLALNALIIGGFTSEAHAWRDWLLRAVAGDPADLQIMYGVQGERRLTEFEVPWLPGYENSAPVRVGNAASGQFQIDVYGETLGSLHTMRVLFPPDHHDTASSWPIETALLEYLEGNWHEPDDGIWEVRGGRQHFTHSKVMAWLAFRVAIDSAERFDLPAPIDRWRTARDQIHRLVCDEGFDAELNSFTQSFGSRQLDGALLQLAPVGFLPARDPRIVGTVAAIERELLHEGLVLRYRSDATADGLPAGEGVFLPCSFWLVDNYVLLGRQRDAQVLFDRLAGLANDVGLLAEEYDPAGQRMLGNFPQAFTHLALVRAASLLVDGPYTAPQMLAMPA